MLARKEVALEVLGLSDLDHHIYQITILIQTRAGSIKNFSVVKDRLKIKSLAFAALQNFPNESKVEL